MSREFGSPLFGQPVRKESIKEFSSPKPRQEGSGLREMKTGEQPLRYGVSERSPERPKSRPQNNEVEVWTVSEEEIDGRLKQVMHELAEVAESIEQKKQLPDVVEASRNVDRAWDECFIDEEGKTHVGLKVAEDQVIHFAKHDDRLRVILQKEAEKFGERSFLDAWKKQKNREKMTEEIFAGAFEATDLIPQVTQLSAMYHESLRAFNNAKATSSALYEKELAPLYVQREYLMKEQARLSKLEKFLKEKKEAEEREKKRKAFEAMSEYTKRQRELAQESIPPHLSEKIREGLHFLSMGKRPPSMEVRDALTYLKKEYRQDSGILGRIGLGEFMLGDVQILMEDALEGKFDHLMEN